MFSVMNTSDIKAAATWSSQYNSQPPVPGESPPSPPGVSKSESTSLENPEWKKAREALAKISPKNTTNGIVTASTGMVPASPLVPPPMVPSYGYPYYQRFYNQYPPPYNYSGYPSYTPPVNTTQMSSPQNHVPTRPSTPRYYLPSVPHPPATQSPISSTPYTTNENHSYRSNGQQNPTSPMQVDQRSPRLPQSETFNVSANNKYNNTYAPSVRDNMYQPQKSIEKDHQSEQQIDPTPSYASIVKNENPYEKQPYEKQPYEKQPYEKQPYEKQPYEKQPYEKQPFWMGGRREQSPVLKPSWESEEKSAPVAKKMKNYRQPEKMQEDNNNTPKISPQDWPPSLKDYVQRAFDQCETEEHKDITENHLKRMLTRAFKEGSAWGVNWDKEPLPK
ncbi:Hypothetical predicted protein [Paramuricea clavata]|nr:Hypothetical predicted protein [Paramuricea clavata]